MRASIAIFLIILMGMTGCSKPVEGQLIQISSIEKVDDGWEFKLTPSSQGIELLEKGIHYSIDVGDPINAANFDTKGCSIVPERQPFPVAEGVSVSYHASGSQKHIWFDGKKILTCNRQGQDECLQIYSTVRLQGGDGGSFFSRVDPELIDPLILELCDAESPKAQ